MSDPIGELCDICLQPAKEGEGRYECIKCKQIVCTSCSHNAGEHGNDVICDDCVRELSPEEREKLGVLEDGE